MQTPRFPRALRPGDRVAVLAPAGPLRNGLALDAGLERLQSWGLRPVLMPHAKGAHRTASYLSGTDEERLADLNSALADPSLRGLLCVRGGYGTTRLLHGVDWDALARDPKTILGFSDITGLQLAAFARTGLVTLHGPNVATGPGLACTPSGWALQRHLLMESKPFGLLSHPPPEGSDGDPPKAGRRDAKGAGTPDNDPLPHVLVPGTAEGRLLGGNLSLVQSLVGTPWMPDTRGAILLLEDVGEAPYRVDRMLTQLRDAGVFAGAAGVLCGDFALKGRTSLEEDPEITRVLDDRLGDLGIPVAHAAPFGHRPRSWTLPLGARAQLRAEDPGAPPTLKLLEPAATDAQDSRHR